MYDKDNNPAKMDVWQEKYFYVFIKEKTLYFPSKL